MIQLSDDQPSPVADFARRRLQLGESLYYKVLEKILQSEQQRVNGSSSTGVATVAGSKTVDLSVSCHGICHLYHTKLILIS